MRVEKKKRKENCFLYNNEIISGTWHPNLGGCMIMQ